VAETDLENTLLTRECLLCKALCYKSTEGLMFRFSKYNSCSEVVFNIACDVFFDKPFPKYQTRIASVELPLQSLNDS